MRLSEGLALQAEHIDSERLLVWIRDGKGARDRAVPLPQPLLHRLRQYWKLDRPQSQTKFFFVAGHGTGPMHETTLQRTFTTAPGETHIEKHASIHTLRHSYATHLLESGISVRTIQKILGHKSLRTTELYLHVSKGEAARVQETLDRLMAEL